MLGTLCRSPIFLWWTILLAAIWGPCYLQTFPPLSSFASSISCPRECWPSSPSICLLPLPAGSWDHCSIGLSLSFLIWQLLSLVYRVQVKPMIAMVSPQMYSLSMISFPCSESHSLCPLALSWDSKEVGCSSFLLLGHSCHGTLCHSGLPL